MIDIDQYIIKGLDTCTFEFMCPYCNKIFKKSKAFDKHVFKHQLKSELNHENN